MQPELCSKKQRFLILNILSGIQIQFWNEFQCERMKISFRDWNRCYVRSVGQFSRKIPSSSILSELITKNHAAY